jgi:restriction endonuclease S subunit
MQNKKKKIKDIAKVILGFTFRSSLSESMRGKIAVLQAKNIKDKLLIDIDDLLMIDRASTRTSALVKDKDVAISSRGNFKSAMICTGGKPIIAAGSTYLIRLESDEVLPEYLAVYLNSGFAQRQIKESLTGVVISTLLKKDLEAIEVIVPSMEQQKKIASLYEYNLALQESLKRKQILTSKINIGLINKLING